VFEHRAALECAAPMTVRNGGGNHGDDAESGVIGRYCAALNRARPLSGFDRPRHTVVVAAPDPRQELSAYLRGFQTAGARIGAPARYGIV
jgi:hypothetical protein